MPLTITSNASTTDSSGEIFKLRFNRRGDRNYLNLALILSYTKGSETGIYILPKFISNNLIKKIPGLANIQPNMAEIDYSTKVASPDPIRLNASQDLCIFIPISAAIDTVVFEVSPLAGVADGTLILGMEDGGS